MAKKGGQQSIQIEINSDEEWELLLQRRGLILVDVYSEWCGPCISMQSNLKRIKLEIGSDLLHMAIANCDRIEKLKRFRGHSEPTWLFIGSGYLLDVIYGSNAPQLLKEIVDKLNMETEVLAGTKKRVFYSFDELTPNEVKKLAEYEAKKANEAARERAEMEAKHTKMKRLYFEKIARKFFNYSLVIFFPNSIVAPSEANQRKTSPAAYKLMSMYDTVGLSIIDQLEIQLNADKIQEIFFCSDYTIHPKVYDLMLREEVIISMVQMMQPLKVVHSTDDPHKALSSILDVVENNLKFLVYGPQRVPENATPESVYRTFETTDEEGDILPPCWTPKDHISKSAAACVIFPTRIADLKVKEMHMPKPSFVMVFEGDRAKDVIETCKAFPSEVLNLGYFDSTDAKTARVVCHTMYDLEHLSDEVFDKTKVVVNLSKELSEPTLALTQLGPLYVSADAKAADEDVEGFFPLASDESSDALVDHWGPPPPNVPYIWRDPATGKEYEELMLPFMGKLRRVRKLIRLDDGTPVEDGEILELTTEDLIEIRDREKNDFEQRWANRLIEREKIKMELAEAARLRARYGVEEKTEVEEGEGENKEVGEAAEEGAVVEPA